MERKNVSFFAKIWPLCGTINIYAHVISEVKMVNLNQKITAVIGTAATAAAVTAAAAVQPAPASAQTFQTYKGQATVNLNVRSTPSTKLNRIGLLHKGQTFDVIGIAGKSEKGNWLKIRYKNESAYVDGTYVKKFSTSSNAKVPEQAVQRVAEYRGVTTDGVNVRFLPSNDGTRLTALSKGTSVTVTGKTADGWLQIKYKDGKAYVFGKFVQKSGNTQSSQSASTGTKTIYMGTTTDDLNVRTGPSTSNKRLTTLKKGTTVSVVGTSGGWLQIKYNGSTAYVSGDYVKKTGSSSSGSESSEKELYKGTTTDNLNVRTGPSASNKQLTTLKKGTTVSVVGTSGGWLQIKYNGSTAYVSGDYVKKSGNGVTGGSESTEKELYQGTTTDNLNVRTGPSTSNKRLTTLKKGTTVSVVGTSGGWLQIKYNGETAYVSGEYVKKTGSSSSGSESTEKELYKGTTTDNLNVRTGPSTSNKLLTTLKKGTTVSVVGTSGGWLQIKYNGSTAYVSGDYVKKSGNGVTGGSESTEKELYQGTTTDNLNVRTGPSTSNKRLTTLKKGTTVSVVGTSGGWLQIKYNGETAYVSGEYVKKSGSSSSGSESSEKELYKGATTDNLNVRTGPSTSNKRLTTLKKGTTVSVVGTSGGWLQIKYNGSTAYVSGEYVKKTGSGAPGGSESVGKELYKGTTTDNLNVRKGPSTSNQRLTTLKRGTTVSVVGTSGGWLQIKYNGSTAYVSGEYVQKIDNDSKPEKSDTSDTENTKVSQTTTGIITAGVRFRKGPGKQYEIMKVLQAGANVEWLAAGPNGWVKISYNGQDGYVYGDYVKKETVTKVEEGNAAYLTTKYPISFGQALALEQKVNASSDLAYYLNPKNFQKGTTPYYQFLKLSSLANLSRQDMDTILKGKGILANYGAEFMNAAKKQGVNEVYLVAHALLETGNGTSALANGVKHKGVKVYNMFGIGAYDGNAVNAGAKYAYEHGWTTPAKAIEGGAAWIAANYIYNSSYQQDTLYKMRWNPEALVIGNAAHQYATDVGWAVKQTPTIHSMYALLKTYDLLYDVPSYQ
ncbi:hypothetical protein EWH99_02200 [Sporolactobacillus sp. THM7-7]|nr:hypothetical protein EWH99_02200 [Sporolactobacillus sp. THM7-7]